MDEVNFGQGLLAVIVPIVILFGLGFALEYGYEALFGKPISEQFPKLKTFQRYVVPLLAFAVSELLGVDITEMLGAFLPVDVSGEVGLAVTGALISIIAMKKHDSGHPPKAAP